jgi:hypothetical protein
VDRALRGSQKPEVGIRIAESEGGRASAHAANRDGSLRRLVSGRLDSESQRHISLGSQGKVQNHALDLRRARTHTPSPDSAFRISASDFWVSLPLAAGSGAPNVAGQPMIC